jgi:hypothetical protein
MTISVVEMSAITQAIWSHPTGVAVSSKLLDIMQRLGLDSQHPLITTQTNIMSGSVNLAMTEVAHIITVARQ